MSTGWRASMVERASDRDFGLDAEKLSW